MSASSSKNAISRRQFAKHVVRAAGLVPALQLGGANAARAAGFIPALCAANPIAATPEVPVPLKIGHRAASMKMVGNFDVFKLARQMPGVIGVELQVASGKPNLRDLDAVRRYKREASHWGMIVPSLPGVWDKGISILKPAAAEPNLLQSIQAAEMLGSSVVLIAFFKKGAPDMAEESSFGPVVQLLQKLAPKAADAGVILGLENSLSPAENKKLVDLVGHPAVKVYYDPCNMVLFGHPADAIPGIKLLGKDRICQVHVKNGPHLLEDTAGFVDWRAAFKELNDIGYDGWYVFETDHKDGGGVLQDTVKNIAFLQKTCRMPVG